MLPILVLMSALAGVSADAPPAPDYARADSWAARPEAGGAATAVAPGATAAGRRPAADVFYVHPTTDRSKTRWNQDIADAEVNRWTDASVIARQAGAFNACCRVFAPRYRQATSRVFAATAGDGAKAYDLAYGDVARAFNAYLKRDNHGRPFILAGHSQGGFHIARLIAERIEGTPLARRMVAAYVLGYNASEGEFGRAGHVAVCATPTQIGCVVQWNAVLATADLADVARRGQQRYIAKHGDDGGKTVVCVNPLTFDAARPSASVKNSLGAVPGDPGFGPIARLVPRSVAARCDNGLLVVDPLATLGLAPLPGGSMHYHDVGLFYADLRANAVARVAAYRQHKVSAAAAASRDRQ